MEHQEYYIYRITCLSSGKSYIGQTQRFKYKDGNPYQYGITGRWCDHVSSAKRSNAPLQEAIRNHGVGSFTHSILETVSEPEADSREAYWISMLNTLVPNGYNATTHSRCKHRHTSNIVDIYLYIDTPTGRNRLTFGQGKTDTFETALNQANAVVEQYRERGVTILSSDKRSPFLGQQLQRIRLVPFHKSMVAIYITDSLGKQTRICFGGKHVSYEDASNHAIEFIRGLQSNCVEINLLKSRQQVAPCSVEANTE
jgi:group I intron endonuclease